MARRGGGVRPRTLTGRLLLWHAVAVVGVLLVLGVVVDRALERSFIGELTTGLVSDARAVQATLPVSPGGATASGQPGGTLESFARRLGPAMGVRVTIIRTDGVVLADSEHDPLTMQNHRDRPEVRQALAGSVGESSRRSATIGISFRYVALPPRDGVVVRVALPLTAVHARQRAIRETLAIGFAAAAIAGLAVLWMVARGVSRPLRRITSALERVDDADVPEDLTARGTDEIRLLASTVNRMRAEVSARIRAAQEERTARDAILSSLEEGVVLLDAAGRSVYQNDRVAELLGAAAERADRLAPPSLQRLVARARGGSPATEEVDVAARARTLLASAIPLPNDERVVLVLRDVTRTRLVEAVRREFVANASHELKTPAASIRALAETISSAASDDPDAIRRFAVQLEAEAVRLAGIVSDLLDLSRLEAGVDRAELVRLDRVASSEVERLAGRAREAGLLLEVRLDEPLSVRASERDLALVVRNLVQNAVQYTRPGGRVEVEAARHGRDAVLTVRDTGIGIPSRERARIFERFYRIDRARSRETGGTGLGLSIVKHVAENLGGSVTVDSRLGEGSTFTVRMPAAVRDAAAILPR